MSDPSAAGRISDIMQEGLVAPSHAQGHVVLSAPVRNASLGRSGVICAADTSHLDRDPNPGCDMRRRQAMALKRESSYQGSAARRLNRVLPV